MWTCIMIMLCVKQLTISVKQWDHNGIMQDVAFQRLTNSCCAKTENHLHAALQRRIKCKMGCTHAQYLNLTTVRTVCCHWTLGSFALWTQGVLRILWNIEHASSLNEWTDREHETDLQVEWMMCNIKFTRHLHVLRKSWCTQKICGTSPKRAVLILCWYVQIVIYLDAHLAYHLDTSNSFYDPSTCNPNQGSGDETKTNMTMTNITILP